MIGHNKTPMYVRTRHEKRPAGETLRIIVDQHLQTLESLVDHTSKGEYVIAIRPVGLTGEEDWDVITSWGEPA